MMSKWLKRIQVALIALTAGGSSLFAVNCDYPLECEPVCSGKFYFDAEALFLRAHEGCLSSPCDVVNVTSIDVGDTRVSVLESREKEPRFDWSWGFRIGAGYGFADNGCCDSEIRAYWTHFDDKTKACRFHWDLHYDTVDLLFRTNYSCNPCLTFVPYAGLRYANIDQKLHTSFQSTFDSELVSTSGRNKQDFRALGPLFGIEGDYSLACGLTVYGNVAVGVLFGHNRVKQETVEFSNLNINVDNLHSRPDAYQYVIDLGFGLRYIGTFCDRTLIVQLGLEDHHYFNYNRLTSCNSGDLNLDGLTLGVAFEF